MSYGDDVPQAERGHITEKEMRDMQIGQVRNGALTRPGEAPIEGALDRCDREASQLGSALEDLVGRLGAALGPERPEPSLGEVRGDGDSSPLAGRLDELADRLERTKHYVLRTLRRVEL